MIKKRIKNICILIISSVIVLLLLIYKGNYRFSRVIDSNYSYNLYKTTKYVSINMNKVNILKITKNDINNSDYDCYVVQFDKEDILVLLSKNTVINDKVKVIKEKDNDLSDKIKGNIKVKNRDVKFDNDYYSNDNVSKIENFSEKKIIDYFMYAIMGLFVFLIFKEIYLIIIKK